jgi:hypothetical protein
MQHAFEPLECMREFRNQLAELKDAASCGADSNRPRNSEPPQPLERSLSVFRSFSFRRLAQSLADSTA